MQSVQSDTSSSKTTTTSELNNDPHNRISRGQAFDIPVIDNELLKLLLPQIQSMFKYVPRPTSITPNNSFNNFFHSFHNFISSINPDSVLSPNENDYVSLITSSLYDDQRRVQEEEEGQWQLNEELRRQLPLQQHPSQQQQQQIQHDYDSYIQSSSSKHITNIVLYFIKGVMIYSTLLYDLATPGMLQLKATFKPPSLSSSSLMATQKRIDRHKNKLFRYLFLSAVLPLIHAWMKLKRTNYIQQLNNTTTTTVITNNSIGRNRSNQSRRNRSITVHNQIGMRRKLLILQSVLKVSSFIIPPLQLYSHISHLFNRSKSSSSSLAMEYADLAYDSLPLRRGSGGVGTNHCQQSINFSYAQRRLFFEEMILTFGMIVPLNVWREMPNTIRTFIKR